MNNNSNNELILRNRSILFTIGGWAFGLFFLAIGLINLFWGNDPGFGVFIMGLSAVYFPPANDLLMKKLSYAIPLLAKIAIGLFIIWAAVGVGELFDKIDMMLLDL